MRVVSCLIATIWGTPVGLLPAAGPTPTVHEAAADAALPDKHRISFPNSFPCEPEVIGSPDGKQRLMLMRENRRRYNSLFALSHDEGRTWSRPREVHAALTGDRHTASYAADGRLVVMSRNRRSVPESEANGQKGGVPVWSGPTTAWVGTYEDVVAGRPGQYRVTLLPYGGYEKLERLPDGTLPAVSYCRYCAEDKGSSIVLTRFALDELDQHLAARRGTLRAAENSLLFQRDTGGWPKNYDRQQELTEQGRCRVMNERSRRDATIDNGATYTEIRLLAEAYHRTKDPRFRLPALRGIDYLLSGQYQNGGWPQRFPDASGYAQRLTFNDGAMVGVLELLHDVTTRAETLSFVPATVRDRCQRAVDRGVDCILKCQVRVEGVPAVWCAQHDRATLQPCQGRSYELPSLSGSESVGIVRFLMRFESPSAEVTEAIEHAIRWFERSRLEGIEVLRVPDPNHPERLDRVVVENPAASPLWARFYDLQTNQPVFCSRDGVPRRTLAEISYERRNGYSWLGPYARELLDDDLPAWRERVGREADRE